MLMLRPPLAVEEVQQALPGRLKHLEEPQVKVFTCLVSSFSMWIYHFDEGQLSYVPAQRSLAFFEDYKA